MPDHAGADGFRILESFQFLQRAGPALDVWRCRVADHHALEARCHTISFEPFQLRRCLHHNLLDKLHAGEDIQADLTALGLKVESHKGVSRFAQEMDQNLLAQAFRMPHPKDGKPSVELVAEANGDRVVVALDKVNVT